MEAVCEISLKAISDNYRFFKARMGGGQVIPVVKANAYGHGAIAVSKHLHELEEVNLFAVATLSEAQELAAELPHISILIFTRIFPQELDQLPENAILTIASMEHAESLQQAGRSVNVHLNVNTGMNRLGVTPDEAFSLIRDEETHLNITGVYSHFSSSDTESHDKYDRQRSIFKTFTDEVRAAGFQGLIHFSNSAAMLHEDNVPYDSMRLGIGLYGYDTYPSHDHQGALTPAMRVMAPLMRLERVNQGESVSYSEKWFATQDTNVGTLRIGYADGYNRLLTNQAFVSLDGDEYPVIGTVTMDHIMIDLGDRQFEPGTYFTVLGGECAHVSISKVAKRLNTITYEICCAISSRVKRSHVIS